QRLSEKFKLYFGQMHSHTSYSDGAGTAQEAYESVKALDQEKWNMDFLSVTDHSNSFDCVSTVGRLADTPSGTEWNEGKQLARDITDANFVGIFGYEMTWSNGLGHINTFNTPGYQARTQKDYSTYSTALQNYYAELKTVPTSISQFNHPGTTFGDFSDFAHYDEEIDQLITLIEVGNGEGAIGSSGYFPSYEYYTRALDKGWHVAPTNNQDNHKGGWGTANTGRDVVLVDELSEDAIYDAMRNYRVYATEDLNLEIYYTFDGNIMGTILGADSYAAGDTAEIAVALNDPNDEAATVEVIVNGGKSLQSQSVSGNGTVTFTVDNPGDYSYYYIRVTQADGDIAVTAPVWVGTVEAVGITSLKAENAITVAGKPQSFTLELYNNETAHLEISSITFTDKASGRVLHTANDVTRVPRLGTATTSFT
ncbi:MAG: CehA/McbA family metallohydrolase, partial [Dysosmobacter sp.]|nr:CehA/McbA family metallohydrolase [Dysosmobacter sp.]